MQPLAIGIDLGCTNIKGVLLDGSGTVLAEVKTDTHEQDDMHWKNSISNIIRDFKKNAPQSVTAIGLSAPGLANAANTCISVMPGRLPGLENFIWSDWIGDEVFVVNDAHAALMAEAMFGSARGLQHAVLISLGTGVGGGLFLNGQLFQGMFQMAGHIGHTTVNSESTSRDITNMPGSIEDAIGNNTLTERSHGKYTSTDALIADFRKGDHFAAWVWLSSVRKLAVCIASTINLLSPEAIILSGGIVQAGDALVEPLHDFLAFYEWRPDGKRTSIKIAQFTDRAGAIGAAGFAISKMK